jgi:serine/threonine protein kinase
MVTPLRRSPSLPGTAVAVPRAKVSLLPRSIAARVSGFFEEGFEETPDTTVDVAPDEFGPVEIIGPYFLQAKIASGGMGTIHLGHKYGPGRFSRAVAVKRVHRELSDDEEFVDGLLEEARLAACIRHANVVPVVDVVEEGRELLLIMEYVHGASVAHLTKKLRPRPFPVRIALAIATGMLRGLHAAHEARDPRDVHLGLVHRDVSPHNILVGTDGVARVTDFGIAKARCSASVTRVGHVKGKLSYLSPEQRLGEPVGRGSDIYSASIVLWEMLTGRKLFEGSEEEIMHAALLNPPVPPSRYNPEVPGWLDAAVLRGLAQSPQGRFPTAKQMAVALEAGGHVATPTELGDWVARTAREELARLGAALVAIEGERVVPTPRPSDRPVAPSAAATPSRSPSSGIRTLAPRRAAPPPLPAKAGVKKAGPTTSPHPAARSVPPPLPVAPPPPAPPSAPASFRSPLAIQPIAARSPWPSSVMQQAPTPPPSAPALAPAAAPFATASSPFDIDIAEVTASLRERRIPWLIAGAFGLALVALVAALVSAS